MATIVIIAGGGKPKSGNGGESDYREGLIPFEGRAGEPEREQERQDLGGFTDREDDRADQAERRNNREPPVRRISRGLGR